MHAHEITNSWQTYIYIFPTNVLAGTEVTFIGVIKRQKNCALACSAVRTKGSHLHICGILNGPHRDTRPPGRTLYMSQRRRPLQKVQSTCSQSMSTCSQRSSRRDTRNIFEISSHRQASRSPPHEASGQHPPSANGKTCLSHMRRTCWDSLGYRSMTFHDKRIVGSHHHGYL